VEDATAGHAQALAKKEEEKQKAVEDATAGHAQALAKKEVEPEPTTGTQKSEVILPRRTLGAEPQSQAEP
jgi:hypothetical protein